MAYPQINYPGYQQQDQRGPMQVPQQVPQAPQPQQVQNGYPQHQSQGPTVIFGRVIYDINQVFPNDVPNDGTPAFFPLADGSAIYVKRWGNDGRIHDDCYILNSTNSQVQNNEPTNREIMDKLNELEKHIHKPYKNPKYRKDRSYEQSNDGHDKPTDTAKPQYSK